MKTIEQMCFSQMNPSFLSKCTIGGWALRHYLLKFPKNHVVKNKIYAFPTRVEVCK